MAVRAKVEREEKSSSDGEVMRGFKAREFTLPPNVGGGASIIGASWRRDK